MIGKNYRTTIADFIMATQEAARPYAFERIEFFVSELDRLNREFEKANLGLEIDGKWIEHNLSYSFEFKSLHQGKQVPLMTMHLLPLKGKEAMVITDVCLTEGKISDGKTHKVFRNLNIQQKADAMLDYVRNTILSVTPKDRKSAVAGILITAEDSHLEDFIATKFSGTNNPRQAYELSILK